MELTVVDNPEQQRYEARTDTGEVAGYSAYAHRGGVIIFQHTEVEAAFEGQGVGSRLVRGALEQLRERGIKVRPSCPFVRAYIERHAEYAPLLDAA